MACTNLSLGFYPHFLAAAASLTSRNRLIRSVLRRLIRSVPRRLSPLPSFPALVSSRALHPSSWNQSQLLSITKLLQAERPMAQEDPVVSAQWLHQHLGQPDIKVLDASWYMPQESRDPWEEYQVAHIPGALFFDIDGIVDRTTDLPHMLPSEEAFAAAVSALGIKNQDKVVVYDGKGFFSAPRVWWMFRVFGHNEVWVLDGGLPQWRASGFNLGNNCPDDTVLKSKAANSVVETVYNGEVADAVTFQTEFQPQLFWTLEKVKHNVAAQAHQLVDARSKGRFDGLAPEPRKGVRSGHIPGTKCVPFPEMFDDAPMLLPADELCKKFEQAGVSLDDPIVVTCGSGVTACILALGLYRIQKHDVPVYDGSWTEWEVQPDTDYPKVTSTGS